MQADNPLPTNVTEVTNTDREIEVFESLVANELGMRSRLLDRMLDPRRDVYKECGLPAIASRFNPWDLWHLYQREAVACRVVECLPKECWQVTPKVYEDEDTETKTAFEEAWDALGSTLRPEASYYDEEDSSAVWEILIRADIMSRIGQYGIIVLGLDDVTVLSTPKVVGGTIGDFAFSGSLPEQTASADGVVTPAQPASGTRKNKLLHVRVFPEAQAMVTQIDGNPSSKRFNLPMMYNVTYNSPEEYATGSIGSTTTTQNVHWSRVIHIADNAGSNEAFGRPAMKPVYNQLMGLMKLYAGSPEMYWKAAFPGISFETHPQLGGDVKVDREAMRSMYERYSNGLQRALYLQGMSAKPLAPQVSDPTPQINILIEAICTLIACPVPVFKGYEIGEQASAQNDDNWTDRLKQRQQTHITPRIICAFVDRLINLGVLPTPSSYRVEWPDIKEQAPTEKATVALTNTQAMVAYVSGGVENLMAPMDYFTRILGLDEDEAQSVMDNAEKGLQEQSDAQAQLAYDQGLPDGSVPGDGFDLPKHNLSPEEQAAAKAPVPKGVV